MTTWRRVAGDTDDTIDVEVLGIDDATAASAWAANVWATGTSAVSGITAAATSASVVRVTLGSWLTTATPGTYNLEITATIGGDPKTWPEGTPDQIIVRAQGA
jgi:uncharacterized membrane protein